MNRDKLIETMTRAAFEAYYASISKDAEQIWRWEDQPIPIRHTYILEQAAALAAAEAAGYVLVPVEPDYEMIEAGSRVEDGGCYSVWKAMLAALKGDTP